MPGEEVLVGFLNLVLLPGVTEIGDKRVPRDEGEIDVGAVRRVNISECKDN